MSSYEKIIASLLTKAGYYFQQEKTFTDLKGGKYRFDFYLPNVSNGTLIECDGQYHFKPIRGRRELQKNKAHDRQKNSYCLSRNIPLYRIPYWVLDQGLIMSAEDLFQDKFLVRVRTHNDDLIVPEN